MSEASDNLLKVRIEQLRTELKEMDDPKGNAFRCGMEYREISGTPHLSFLIFNLPVEIKYPELVVRDVYNGKSLNTAYQALVCYYLVTSARASIGHHLESKWVSFADLPDGRFYNQSFQGYTGNRLAAQIESDKKKFSQIAMQMKGSALGIGDVGYQFLALPRVPVGVVFWGGDEEFPSNCQFLFNSNVSKHLPTDTCAILGSMLTQMILKQMENESTNG